MSLKRVAASAVRVGIALTAPSKKHPVKISDALIFEGSSDYANMRNQRVSTLRPNELSASFSDVFGGHNRLLLWQAEVCV